MGGIDYTDPNFYWPAYEYWRQNHDQGSMRTIMFDYTNDYWPAAVRYNVNRKIADRCERSLCKVMSRNQVWIEALEYNRRPMVDETNLFFDQLDEDDVNYIQTNEQLICLRYYI